MSKDKLPKIKWLKDAEKKDYKAATSYLHLLFKRGHVSQLLKRLKHAASEDFEAKDVFRASRLPMLSASSSAVAEARTDILSGAGISPILLVRDPQNGGVIVADGYHRMCAVYGLNEDVPLRCKIT